jgi:acyl-coenzyme A thioesterase 13
MPDMIPFDGDAAARALGILQNVPFAGGLHRAPKAEVMDPIPPINAKGGRSIPPEGWRSVYSVVVTEGEWSCG